LQALFGRDRIFFGFEDVSARAPAERGVEFISPPQKQPCGTFAIMKNCEANQFVLGSD
jgi:hypothetical protein